MIITQKIEFLTLFVVWTPQKSQDSSISYAK